jgi:carboxypeptidase D
MHGDEPLGTELCLKFIDRLLDDYGTDARITRLVDTTEIWLVPLMNPDGLTLGTRFNAEGYDLNRSFPAYPEDFTGTIFDGEPLDTAGRPVEVAHVMRWTAEHSFVLSANLHTGSLVVNYPYDDDGKPSGTNSPTPDDLLFRDVSMRYSKHNLPMWHSARFTDGITNGAAWYVVVGGMQDWNYRYAACNEVTIELSNTKALPAAAGFAQLCADNEESMLRYLEAVHIGVRGLVLARATRTPLCAEVRVEGNDHAVYTDPDVGDYHRMLLPGTYALTFSAPNCVSRTIPDITVGDREATRVDADLIDADVNSDGTVNAVDVQLVIDAILGRPVPYDGDVDGGGVTATDLQTVINVVLQRE